MTPIEWANDNGGISEFWRKVAAWVKKPGRRPLVRQTLERYMRGRSFPPDDVIGAAHVVSGGDIARKDWERVARSAGLRANKDGTFTNHRKHANGAAPATRSVRSRRKP